MPSVILVCSRDAEFYLLLEHILRHEGFETRLAASDDDAVGTCASAAISAVLVDCGSWPSEVAPLCALLKEAGLPVGALISGDMRAQHLQLIRAGLEEVIMRPLSPPKLFAFLNTVRPRPEAVTAPSVVVPAEFVIERHAVVFGGKRISLSPIEARILKFLLERQGQVSTREQLIEAVWPNPRPVDRRTVDVHIGRLRRAVAELRNLRVRTVYGVGYSLEFQDA
ncbi:response regulator with CheY-like receiver domain and winged-helix DNA-binding domain [Rhizobium leguminosarum bv. trifolii WSM2297]|uniref:Response regulator with CheY-like receiver domain and winged-helix DNA-binding domain n=1 Tax=Rhizobium leguminosarum bv. trifolii WSM2297 TaxID=754762 RepID=J0CW66_RHILT|nr:response regulator transcription factor [Rhizobium leguminosarum]EJC84170.1 response regulator with CheY-like receiver domain and winged-helix DNA-binding domain [Rhizobium leguminosarum bv. trifolii WSM2297]